MVSATPQNIPAIIVNFEGVKVSLCFPLVNFLLFLKLNIAITGIKNKKPIKLLENRKVKGSMVSLAVVCATKVLPQIRAATNNIKFARNVFFIVSFFITK